MPNLVDERNRSAVVHAGRRRRDQRHGSPQDSTELFIRYRRTRERADRNELIERHRWIAGLAAKRLRTRGEPYEDLHQVALLGLLKAVERYDPERGVSFATFAMPTVLGELRRHFRDTTWAVHVPRRAKELFGEVQAVRDRLAGELRRPPTTAELAAALGTSEEVALQAQEAANAYRTTALAPAPGSDRASPEDVLLGMEDARLVGVCDHVALREVMRRLPERQRQILLLRFSADLRQRDIATQLGISQVHVSRLLRDALRKLRVALDESETA
ncbi:MAG: SigB/SigF/SigG family RNA polymerase sigma factor [Acidimicrobiia bacterium]